jgi:hypothetical protein
MIDFALDHGNDRAGLGKRVLLAAGMPRELRKAAAGARFAPDGDEQETGENQGPWPGGKTDG